MFQTGRSFSLLLLLLALPLASACESEMSARLREAGQVTEGSPVLLAGVRVGEVQAMELAGGDAPVVVRFSVSEDHEEAIAAGACSRAEGASLLLVAGSDSPVQDGQIAACEPSFLEGLQGAGELLRGAVEGVREGVEEELRQGLAGPNAEGGQDLTREAARRLGERLRGAAEGVREGLGDDAPRELGRAVGHDADQFIRGVEEGMDESAARQ